MSFQPQKALRLMVKTIWVLVFMVGSILLGGILYLKHRPLPLNFLTTYVQQALREDNPDIILASGSVHLAWRGLYPKVEIYDLRFEMTGGILLTIPQVDVEMSLQSLWQKKALPRQVILHNPHIAWTSQQTSLPLPVFRLEDLLVVLKKIREMPDLKELKNLVIVGGVFSAGEGRPQSHVHEGRLRVRAGEMHLSLEGEVRHRYQQTPYRAEFHLNDEGVHPVLQFWGEVPYLAAALMREIPAWLMDVGIDCPVNYSGPLFVKGQGAWQLREGSFPTFSVHLHSLSPATLTAPWLGGEVAVEEVDVDLGWKGPGDASLGALSINQFRLREGATLRGQGLIQAAETQERLDVHLEGSHIDVSRLNSWWPEGLGEDARAWVIGNISEGQVPVATLKSTLTKSRCSSDGLDMLWTGEWSLEALSGDIQIEDVTVQYIEGMPLVRNVSGHATFSPQDFTIHVTRGVMGQIEVTGAEVILGALNEVKSKADITIHLRGDAAEGVHLLSLPPLNYTPGKGLELDILKGRLEGQLRLRFPLVDNLELRDIQVEAEGAFQKISGTVSVGQGLLALKEGAFQVRVEPNQVSVKGTSEVEGNPLSFAWENYFSSTASLQNHYRIEGVVPTQLSQAFGIKLAPDVMGDVGLNVEAVEGRDGHLEITAQMNMEATHLSLPGLKWEKMTGYPAQGTVQAEVSAKGVWTIPHFSLSCLEGRAEGHVVRHPQGLEVFFAPFQLAENDIDGSLVLREGSDGWMLDKMTIKGRQLNLRPYIEQPSQEEIWRDGVGYIDVAKVLMEKGETAHHLRARWKKKDSYTEALRLTFDWGTPHQHSNTITLQTLGEKRVFKADVQDFGRLLRALDCVETLVEGHALLQATSEGFRDEPFKGHLLLKDFRLKETPVLAQLLSLLSVQGLLNLLRGGGIMFDEAQMHFEKHEDHVKVVTAHLASTALGLSFQGTYHIKPPLLALKGKIVPAYLLNSTLGSIPLIGPLLSGGTAHEGIFAASFEISGSPQRPEVTVNPFSLLTPGIVGKFFQSVEPVQTDPRSLKSS